MAAGMAVDRWPAVFGQDVVHPAVDAVAVWQLAVQPPLDAFRYCAHATNLSSGNLNRKGDIDGRREPQAPHPAAGSAAKRRGVLARWRARRGAASARG